MAERALEKCFVLLDDAQATAQSPSSRLYTDWVRTHVCTAPSALDALWEAVEADQRQGLHAAILIDYEWGAKLQQAGHAQLSSDDGAALRVLLFKNMRHCSDTEVQDWLQAQDAMHDMQRAPNAPSPAGVMQLQASVDEAAFEAAIDRIHAYIRQGETYQVNYTYRLHGKQFGPPIALYRRLRALQPVAFGALVCMGGTHSSTDWVLSRSPELFLRHTQGTLTARPMKGTAARSASAQDDAQSARWLAQDPKNRAENVMIVDLLRNDLARISQTGSVRVPQLMHVESYSTVHQMTSTVQSTLRPEVRFPEVLRALFPCGSITGAPKIHTMDLIALLENTPRDVYCGAIGWFDAPAPSASDNGPAQSTCCGDFCLNVAIRTLTLGPAQHDLRPVTLGIGAGVVIDSHAASEFAETQLKARFLTQLDPGFTLFETLRYQHGRIHQLAAHLTRLQRSAQALGFAYDEDAIRSALAQCTRALPPNKPYRLRLDLHKQGHTTTAHAPLDALPAGPLALVLAAQRPDRTERALLGHKTSLRSTYDHALQAAIAQGAFDAVFVNAQGELTEGARSTVWYQQEGRWWTPPLACGVLPGTLRARLLRDGHYFGERRLSVDALAQVQDWMVGNALRGLRKATLRLPNSGV